MNPVRNFDENKNPTQKVKNWDLALRQLSNGVNRRGFIKSACFGAATLAWPGIVARASCPGSRATNLLNFLFILADDLGWSQLGCYGRDPALREPSDFYETPNLDRLANEGMRFTDA
ncbi:MAG: sulfatase-like hydrolase/transferase, partial [Phycisphaerae bacterium]